MHETTTEKILFRSRHGKQAGSAEGYRSPRADRGSPGAEIHTENVDSAAHKSPPSGNNEWKEEM